MPEGRHLSRCDRLKILVTGGAGYIGSVCAEVLIARGFQVIAVDNLSEGHKEAVPPEATFVHADIGDRAQLEKLFTRFEIDAVMHFAGEALVEKSMREPSAFYAANVGYGVLLIDAMVRHQVKKLVFSSSCAVYGEPKYLPITEEHPLEPVNSYGKSKMTFERILLDYQSYKSLDSVSLRYFNVAGASSERGEAHRTETHLIPRVLDVALGLRSKAEVCGADYGTSDGTCVRDYVHVLDIAEAHVAALDCFARVVGRSFNVGTGLGYSILEIVNACRKITGHQIPVEFAPRRPGDPSALIASGKALESAIGWKPTHSTIEEIVESAWVWRQRFPNAYC
jgi:UDP-glucose 4-epimerase